MKTAIINIGTIVSGDWREPLLPGDAIAMADGRITSVGSVSDAELNAAEVVIDAGGATVCPGLIETPMVAQAGTDSKLIETMIAAEPIGRMGQPNEIGQAVAWLCSDKASFVTGHCMPVDGGYVAQ